MRRTTPHVMLLTLAGTMLLLSSCRTAQATAPLGAESGTAMLLDEIMPDPRVTSDGTSRLAMLRYANRLPSVPFPRMSSECLGEGEVFGAWTVRFSGYGCVSTTARGQFSALTMGPKAAEKQFQTHAPMVLGPSFGSRVMFHMRVETTAQLRKGVPNPWEVAWVIWHYSDDAHFYYFIPKPNGWELGKRDPSYPGGQRFLASGRDQEFPIGHAYDVTVVQIAQDVAVFVGGREIVRLRDEERPYRAGRIGVYSEDATVKVDRVRAL
jgi:hypothetical protein